MSWSPGMNRMTVAMFERLIGEGGLRPLRRRYRTAGGLPVVDGLPFLREFFVNMVDAELAPAEQHR